MKIGIDAKWYFEGPPSGKVVTQNIVEQIITLYPQHHFVFFLDSRYSQKNFPFQRNNVTVKYIFGKINLLSNIFVLPFAALFYKIDCLIAFNFVPPFGKFKKIGFIFDVIFDSNPEHFTYIERMYFKPIRLLSKFAARLCTLSQNEKERMLSYNYGSRESIDVVYIGVNNVFRPHETYSHELLQHVKTKYNLPEQFILYVGRLNDRKNLKNLIQSLNAIKNETIPLLFFGSYDWKSINLDEIIARNNLQHRVFRKGFADQEDLPILYSLASVFTFVSYEEGFGLPILESMASGVPCVVADTPVFRELFTDCVLYANPNDPSDIAHQIDLLLNDKDLHANLRKKSIERASYFSWERSAHSLLKSVEKAVL